MMDYYKKFFIFIFLIVVMLLWYIWQMKFSFSAQEIDNKIINQNLQLNKYITSKINNKIYITTDVFKLVINKIGGDIEEVKLLKYNEQINSLEHLRILYTSPNFLYHAQSGLTGKNGPDNPINQKRPTYFTSKNFFKLKQNSKELRVPMRWISKDGIIYIKTFIFHLGEYVINVQFDVYNNTKKNLELSIFGQLKQSFNLFQKHNIFHNITLKTFRGVAFSTTTHRYSKYNFDLIQENKNISKVTDDGWVAMLQQYFATAWIPQNHGKNIIYTKNLGHGIVAIGYKSDNFHIQPHYKYTIQSKLWIGPENQKQMALVAPYLDLTVDYGWLWFFSQPLFKILSFLNKIIHNWGLSIILITFIMKVIMFPLSRMQYIAVAKMRILQPKINQIKEQYSHNKKQMNQEIIKLYQVEKLNPLGGCLPLLLQMPIFLALYYMLIGSIELRHAPFILWIHDLSSKDPYFILPMIMGLTMFFIQKISPSIHTDPIQQKIMGFMPVVFTVFFLWFPSGLVLYYIISNLLTLVQQYLIFKKLENK